MEGFKYQGNILFFACPNILLRVPNRQGREVRTLLCFWGASTRTIPRSREPAWKGFRHTLTSLASAAASTFSRQTFVLRCSRTSGRPKNDEVFSLAQMAPAIDWGDRDAESATASTCIHTFKRRSHRTPGGVPVTYVIY